MLTVWSGYLHRSAIVVGGIDGPGWAFTPHSEGVMAIRSAAAHWLGTTERLRHEPVADLRAAAALPNCTMALPVSGPNLGFQVK
jgi:hypothetical protein